MAWQSLPAGPREKRASFSVALLQTSPHLAHSLRSPGFGQFLLLVKDRFSHFQSFPPVQFQGRNRPLAPVPRTESPPPSSGRPPCSPAPRPAVRVLSRPGRPCVQPPARRPCLHPRRWQADGPALPCPFSEPGVPHSPAQHWEVCDFKSQFITTVCKGSI